jgi:hypothetical protein
MPNVPRYLRRMGGNSPRNRNLHSCKAPNLGDPKDMHQVSYRGGEEECRDTETLLDDCKPHRYYLDLDRYTKSTLARHRKEDQFRERDVGERIAQGTAGTVRGRE